MLKTRKRVVRNCLLERAKRAKWTSCSRSETGL